MLRHIILTLISSKNYSQATRHVVALKPTIIARAFHVNPLYRSNCDFGSPCNCTECTENAKRSICEVCQVRPAVNQSSELSRDRKGISSYTFTSFCEQCWEKDTADKRRRGREIAQTLASRKEKTDKMMKYVRGLHSTEQVPIGYAVEKFLSDTRSLPNSCNSQRWHQRDIINCLSQDLQIVKVRNRYMCNKRRVDGMDFKLWIFYQRPDIEVWDGSNYRSCSETEITAAGSGAVEVEGPESMERLLYVRRYTNGGVGIFPSGRSISSSGCRFIPGCDGRGFFQPVCQRINHINHLKYYSS